MQENKYFQPRGKRPCYHLVALPASAAGALLPRMSERGLDAALADAREG